MIGMVNVPCDSPLDFYASPSRQDSVIKDGDAIRTPSARRPSYRPVFMSHRTKVQYNENGRKLTDGVYAEQEEPNKLWEELLLRSFAQRMEEEIQSPVAESFKNLDQELAKLNVKDKSLYRSTYSLVSANRVEHTTLEDLDQMQKKVQRSASSERLSACSFIPFIKSIKGKSKNRKKSSA